MTVLAACLSRLQGRASGGGRVGALECSLLEHANTANQAHERMRPQLPLAHLVHWALLKHNKALPHRTAVLYPSCPPALVVALQRLAARPLAALELRQWVALRVVRVDREGAHMG